ncbi:DUF2290 domain-containing protein [Providencia rettgeri]
MTPQDTCDAINRITRHLMTEGLSDSQNFSSVKNKGAYVDVIYNGYGDVSKALRDVPYEEMYDYLDNNSQFSIKMLDGGLIHYKYRFMSRGELAKHTLAYYPAPHFKSFQNEPELYLDESHFYSEVISKNILPVPLRFDYAPEDAASIEHPASHLTLGQYKNCRIPLSAPLCPVSFTNFILQSFYNTAFVSIKHTQNSYLYSRTISREEEKILHFNIT